MPTTPAMILLLFFGSGDDDYRAIYCANCIYMFVGAAYMRCDVMMCIVKTELNGGYNKMDGLEQILMSKDVEVVTLKDVAIGKWDRDQVKLNATNMHYKSSSSLFLSLLLSLFLSLMKLATRLY
jgi:hypothetical protein